MEFQCRLTMWKVYCQVCCWSRRIHIDTGFSSGYIDGVKEAIKCGKLTDLLVETAQDNESSEVPLTLSCPPSPFRRLWYDKNSRGNSTN